MFTDVYFTGALYNLHVSHTFFPCTKYHNDICCSKDWFHLGHSPFQASGIPWVELYDIALFGDGEVQSFTYL